MPSSVRQQLVTLNCLAFTHGTKADRYSLYGQGFFNRNNPEEAHRFMHLLAAQGNRAKYMVFTPTGGWSILHQFNNFMNPNIPEPAHHAMMRIVQSGPE